MTHEPVNFDRVAEVYDATRGLPEEVAGALSEAIVSITHAVPETSMLELGVGTGRIALPLLRHALNYTGVDISEAMMARLRAKVPPDAGNLTLVQADITDLPFADAAFDVVLAVHIFHLVPAWKRALAEARRVMRPGGYLVLGGNSHVEGTPGREIREAWHRIAVELGAALRPEHGSREEVERALIESGGWLAEYRVAQWEERIVPAELIEHLHQRVFSHTWALSDEILDAVTERLRQWAAEQYGDPSQPVTTTAQFGLLVARWQDE